MTTPFLDEVDRLIDCETRWEKDKMTSAVTVSGVTIKRYSLLGACWAANHTVNRSFSQYKMEGDIRKLAEHTFPRRRDLSTVPLNKLVTLLDRFNKASQYARVKAVITRARRT